jgi:nucleoside-diphosphate-sugar epimerase
VDKGHSVVILDNISTGYRKNVPTSPRVGLVEGDIRDAATVKSAAQGAQVIFHLAASVGNQRSINDPVTDSMVNILGTLNVLEAAGVRVGVRYAPPRKGDVRHSKADISAAQGDFGFAPQVDLVKGLKEYMTWIRAEASS